MSVYQRYFKVLDKPTVEAINEKVDARNEYLKKLDEIRIEVGAKEVFMSNRNDCYGFKFDEYPDKSVWRRNKNRDMWLPKRSSKAGKELSDKINAIPRPGYIEEALEPVGLKAGFSGALMEGLTIHEVCVAGSKDKGWFACVPWKDADPSTIETGDYLAWTPPAEWIEVKEWEVLRDLDEYMAWGKRRERQ